MKSSLIARSLSLLLLSSLPLACVGNSESRRGGPEAAYSGPFINFSGEVAPSIEGRVARDDQGGVKMAWSGTALSVRFRGSAVSVDITDNGKNQYLVLIDGKPIKEKVTPSSGRTTVSLVKGLARGQHTVTLYRLNEPLVGTSTVHGFVLDEHAEALPQTPDNRPRLLLIGDSISAGYGNEGRDETCHFSPETENHFLSYGARTARELGANLTTVAWSGKGVFSNRGNEVDPMPVLWTKSLPAEGIDYPEDSPPPQAVVINLGTNDFAPEVADVTPFEPAYDVFLSDVRTHYPEAHILVTVGPLLTDAYPEGKMALSTVRNALSSLVETRKKSGDARIHYLEYAQTTEDEGRGCDWHPSVKTHSRMAATLVRALREHAGF